MIGLRWPWNVTCPVYILSPPLFTLFRGRKICFLWWPCWLDLSKNNQEPEEAVRTFPHCPESIPREKRRSGTDLYLAGLQSPALSPQAGLVPTKSKGRGPGKACCTACAWPRWPLPPLLGTMSWGSRQLAWSRQMSWASAFQHCDGTGR